MRYLDPVCRGLLLVVFLWSATSKIRSRRSLREFASSLSTMRLVGVRHAGPVAVSVAGAEAVVVALLAIPPLRAAGFLAAGALLSLLTGGVALVLRRGEAAPCRCFGSSPVPLGRRHLIRNVLLVGVALVGLLAQTGQPALAGSLVAGAAGALLGLLVAELDEIVQLFAPIAPQRKETS